MLLTWLKNFINHPTSTVQGVAGGSALVGAFWWLSETAGCEWHLISLSNFLAFLVPVLIGGGAGSPAPDPKPEPTT